MNKKEAFFSSADALTCFVCMLFCCERSIAFTYSQKLLCPVIKWEVPKCDPRSIRSTDCSVISQGGRPVQDNFQDHQSQLDVGDVCDLFSFTIYFTICSRTERSHFCQDCTGLFFVCSRCQTIQLPASSKQ